MYNCHLLPKGLSYNLIKMEQVYREKKENTKENQSGNKKVFDDEHCVFFLFKAREDSPSFLLLNRDWSKNYPL